jgi:hypothetical protein
MRANKMIGFFSLITSCADKPSESEPYWGHLNYSPNAWIANIGPQSTISTCGNYADEGAESIKIWAAAIGRASDLKIQTTSCEPQAYLSPSSANHQYEFRTAVTSFEQTYCKENILAFASAEMRLVVVCRPDVNLKGVMLHEVGHLWGMCDQYPIRLSSTGEPLGDNCDPVHRTSERQGDSVMGAGGLYSELTATDAEGIKALSLRTDIPANKEWRDYLSSQDSTESSQSGPKLGVRIEQKTLDGHMGLHIVSVEPGSLAEAQNLRAGMILKKLNGVQLTTIEALQKILKERHGQRAKLEIYDSALAKKYSLFLTIP